MEQENGKLGEKCPTNADIVAEASRVMEKRRKRLIRDKTNHPHHGQFLVRESSGGMPPFFPWSGVEYRRRVVYFQNEDGGLKRLPLEISKRVSFIILCGVWLSQGKDRRPVSNKENERRIASEALADKTCAELNERLKKDEFLGYKYKV